jgi:hypothetical protein
MASFMEDKTQPSPQRPSRSQANGSVEDPSATEDSYLVVHRVHCSESDQPNHEKHEAELDYLDVPRLFAGANQTSRLKGTKPFDNIEWYLEDNPGVHFAIINIYDCLQYHREIADQFVRLQLPSNIDSRVVGQIRPYLCVLEEDAKEADRSNQILMPSLGLSRALDKLKTLYKLELGNWSAKFKLAYPYPQLWHCKDLLRNLTKELPPGDRSRVATLCNYLELEISDEWIEAEDMFEKGIVSKQHWKKLFRPNELGVTLLDGEPRAFVCEENYVISSGKLRLACWSWEFDGNFYQREFSVDIVWPDRSEVTRITGLSHYPLRFNTSDLANRLASRGATFWSCRQRKYVSYRSPSQDTNGQSVSSCRNCFRVPSLMSIGSATLYG